MTCRNASCYASHCWSYHSEVASNVPCCQQYHQQHPTWPARLPVTPSIASRMPAMSSARPYVASNVTNDALCCQQCRQQCPVLPAMSPATPCVASTIASDIPYCQQCCQCHTVLPAILPAMPCVAGNNLLCCWRHHWQSFVYHWRCRWYEGVY